MSAVGRRVLCIGLFALSACNRQPASHTDPNVAACASEDHASPQTLAGCNALIESKSIATDLRVFGYGRRGMLRSMARDHAGALTDANRAVELDPKSADALVNRGVVLNNAGEVQRAIVDLKQAVSMQPDHAYARFHLSDAYERAQTPALGLEHLYRAVELAPDKPGIIAQRCWILAILNRDLSQAMDDCNHAIAGLPKEGNVYNSRAFVHFRLHEYESSIVDYDQSVRLNPHIPSSYYVRGLAKHAVGRGVDGDADIALGLARDPGVADRFARYGVAPASAEPTSEKENPH